MIKEMAIKDESAKVVKERIHTTLEKFFKRANGKRVEIIVKFEKKPDHYWGYWRARTLGE